MKIDSLRLQNIRSYEQEQIEFPEGTILIHGENGAGKTSLLMALFGGLYQTSTTSAGTNSFNLDDFVRRGADKAEIELTFTVDGVGYTSLWEIYTTSTANSAELRSEALSEPVSGITAVQREVSSLLGMDEEDFVNSVYIQQGGIDRLINATDRAAMIDGLLGLDQIDTYADRIKEARKAVGRVKKDNKSNADSRRARREDDFDRGVNEFESAIGSVQEQIDTIETRIDEAEAYLSNLEDELGEVDDELQRHDELTDQKTSLTEQIDKLNDEIQRIDTQVDEHRETVSELAEEINQLDAEIATIGEDLEQDVSTRHTAQDAYEAALGDETEAKQAVQEAKNELNNFTNERTSVTADRDRLASDLERIDDKITDLEDELDELTQERDHLNERIDARHEQAVAGLDKHLDAVDDPEAISFANKDPFFELEGDDDPHIDRPALPDDDVRSQLRVREEALADRVDELSGELDSLNESIPRTESKRDATKSQLSDAQTTLSDLRDELETRKRTVQDARQTAEELATEYESRWEGIVEQAGQYNVDIDASVTVSVPTEPDADIGKSTPVPQTVAGGVIATELEEISDEQQAASDRKAELEASRDRFQDQREELLELADEGTCPRCRQPVDDTHVDEELAEIDSQLAEIDNELETVRHRTDRLAQRDGALDELQGALQDLANFRRSELDPAFRELTTALSRRDEQAKAVAEQESTLAELESELEDASEKLSDLTDRREQVSEDLAEAEEEHDAVREVHATVRHLIESYTRRDELSGEIDDLSSTLESELRPEYSDLADQIDKKEERLAELEDNITEQEQIVADRQNKATRISEAVVKPLDKITDLYSERQELAEERDDLVSEIDYQEQQITDLEEEVDRHESERKDVREELEDIDTDSLKSRKTELESEIEETETKLDKASDKRDDLRDRKTTLINRRNELQKLNARIDAYDERAQWANQRYAEFDRLLTMYEDVKSELRSEYLAYLNQYVNDIFDDLYTNTSYQRIVIDEKERINSDRLDYSIQLQRDDGSMEDPSNASGGERALVNLALRTGIYRLIAELQGGHTAELPPLILDEPTTFLDNEHVSQLETMLTSIREWDVPQVFVVSHDTSLVDGADHTCEITRDDRTNTSTATITGAGDSDQLNSATLTGGDD